VDSKTQHSVDNIPVSHWQSQLTVNIMTENIALDYHNLPGELFRYVR